MKRIFPKNGNTRIYKRFAWHDVIAKSNEDSDNYECRWLCFVTTFQKCYKHTWFDEYFIDIPFINLGMTQVVVEQKVLKLKNYIRQDFVVPNEDDQKKSSCVIEKEYDDYQETLLLMKHGWVPNSEFWKKHNRRKIFNWVLRFAKIK